MPNWTERVRRVPRSAWPVYGVVALYFVHRLLVALSAGDFLYPIEPSEAKNTQIAWDLMTGRLGTEGFELHNYVVNSGSVHHASYSTMAAAYWVVSRFLGFGLLSVRAVPLLFTTAGLAVLLETLRRVVGPSGAVLAGLGLVLAPTAFIGFNLTFLGCHPESVLPLALTIAAWLAATATRWQDPRLVGLLGLCVGYSTIFSYLLWPLLAVMGLLCLLPPWPTPRLATLKSLAAGVVGFVVGLWPLWFILITGGVEALSVSITEDGSTTITNTARGLGISEQLFRETFHYNLPSGHDDYWMHNELPALWGDLRFESIAYHGMAFGSLLLLPWALLERDGSARRLGVLVALAPALAYLWLCFASPWKPFIPHRYFIPFSLLGLAAPGVGLGLAIRRIRAGGWMRHLGWPLAAICVGWALWLAGPRAVEATEAVRLDRIGPLLQHRYATYYNLGAANVWAHQVPAVNDFIDVRSHQAAQSGNAVPFAGSQAALWGTGARMALPRQEWAPPPLDWGMLRSGLREWEERQSYKSPEEKEDLGVAAQNIGWGAGIRADWQARRVFLTLKAADAAGEWPFEISRSLLWEGYGYGYGRARPDASADPSDLDAAIPEHHREAVSRGMKAGRAQGEVPRAPRKPLFPTTRGPAT